MKRSIACRTASILLSILLICTILAGCGSSNEGNATSAPTTVTDSSSVQSEATAATEVKEPITMKIFSDQADPATSAETSVGAVIKEKFNIDFEFAVLPPNYSDQCNIWLASGDYPEVFMLPSMDIYQKYIDAGALICLEDYLAQMPDFTQLRAQQIPLWRTHSKDGKLYKWENASPQSPAAFMDDFDFIVRTDVLEKQGWPKTITASEYIDFLKQALKDFPQTDNKKTVGLTFSGGETWGVNLVYGLADKGDRYSYLNGFITADMKDKKYLFKFTIPETKESVKFFNDLYRADLLDKECFTLKDADVLAKMTTGQAVIDYYTRWNTASANSGLDKNGKPERQYIELPIRLDSQSGQKRQFVQSLVRPTENLVITKNCKNPDRFFELLDWWQTDEAQILYGTGIKDVDYKVENGKRVPLTPLEGYLKGENPNWAVKAGVMESFDFAYSLGGRYDNSPTDNQPYRITKDPDIISQYGLSDRQRAAYKALGWKNAKSWYYENGEFYYDGVIKGISIDPASDFGKKSSQISDLSNRYASKLIFSKTEADFEANYAAMLAEMEKLEPMKIIDEYNKLLAEAMTKLK